MYKYTYRYIYIYIALAVSARLRLSNDAGVFGRNQLAQKLP